MVRRQELYGGNEPISTTFVLDTCLIRVVYCRRMSHYYQKRILGEERGEEGTVLLCTTIHTCAVYLAQAGRGIGARIQAPTTQSCHQGGVNIQELTQQGNSNVQSTHSRERPLQATDDFIEGNSVSTRASYRWDKGVDPRVCRSSSEGVALIETPLRLSG